MNYPFKVKHNISLTRISTFAIGGLAKNYVPVKSSSDLLKVLNFFHKTNIDFRIFSGGSNIVFPDGGIKYHLIHLVGGQIKLSGHLLSVDAGILLSKVIAFSVKNSIKGLENLSGIPGSLGGAVVGNAGAYGSSVSDNIKTVKIWNRGKIRILTGKDCRFDYRESIFKKKPYVIISVAIETSHSKRKQLEKISREIIKVRTAKYKTGLKCPGSFFKNILAKNLPPEILNKINPQKIVYGKIPAGYLLESVGAKTMKKGYIEIAPFHGNLFINKGRGTAKDVKELAQILKSKVYRKFGILLEEEIRYF